MNSAELLAQLKDIQNQLKALSGHMIMLNPFELQEVILTTKKLHKDIENYNNGVRDLTGIKEGNKHGVRFN